MLLAGRHAHRRGWLAAELAEALPHVGVDLVTDALMGNQRT